MFVSCLDEPNDLNLQEKKPFQPILGFDSMNPHLGRTSHEFQQQILNNNLELKEQDSLQEYNNNQQSQQILIKQQDQIKIQKSAPQVSSGQGSTDNDESDPQQKNGQNSSSHQSDISNQQSDDTQQLNGADEQQIQDNNNDTTSYDQCKHKNAFKLFGAHFKKQIFKNQEFQIIIKNNDIDIENFQEYIKKDLKGFISKEMFAKIFLEKAQDHQKNQEQISKYREVLRELYYKYFNGKLVEDYINNKRSRMSQQNRNMYGKLIQKFKLAYEDPKEFNEKWYVP